MVGGRGFVGFALEWDDSNRKSHSISRNKINIQISDCVNTGTGRLDRVALVRTLPLPHRKYEPHWFLGGKTKHRKISGSTPATPCNTNRRTSSAPHLGEERESQSTVTACVAHKYLAPVRPSLCVLQTRFPASPSCRCHRHARKSKSFRRIPPDSKSNDISD